MADKTTTSLTAGTIPLVGTELVYGVQGGNSRKFTASQVAQSPHTQAWGTITGTPTTLSGYGITDAQPLDSDLTAISALTTTGYGRDFLALADEAAFKAYVNLEIGVDVQAQGATLTSLEGLSLVNGDLLYSTGADTLARRAIGTAGQVLQVVGGVPTWSTVSGTGDLLSTNNLSDVASAATSRTNLGLAIGSNVQAFSTNLSTLAAVTPGATGLALLDDTTPAAARTTIGVVIGTDVQAFSANLTTLAAVTPGATGLALLDDTTAAAARTTLGAGTAGASVFTSALVADVRDLLDTPVYVVDRTALKAIDTTKDKAAILMEAGREGTFVWTSGNFSTQITADTAEGIYVKATAIASSAGAWVRVYSGNAKAAWFGSNQAAIVAGFVVVDTLDIDTAFALTSNVTFASGKKFVFRDGGVFNVATAVTVTIRGAVRAARMKSTGPNKIFTLTGTGAVVGVKQVFPEWWGAVGNGSTDDAPAIKAAIASVEGAGASDGEEFSITFAPKTYAIASTITFTPTSTIHWRVRGAGSIASFGAYLLAKSTFTGTQAVYFAGSVGATAITSYSIHNLNIRNQTGGSGASIGLQFGTNATNVLNGYQQNLVEHVHVGGFATNWQFQNIRLIEVKRCSGWAQDSTGAEVANTVNCVITVSGSGGFTGDIDFVNSQFVGAFGSSAPSGTDVLITNSAGGTSWCSGIGFTNTIFYGSQIQLSFVTGASGSGISDVWVNPRCQFEGPVRGAVQTRAVNFSASGAASSIIRNINILGSYMSGNGHHRSINAAVATSGVINNVFIHGNFCANAADQTMDIRATGGAINGLNIKDNNVYGSAGAIGIYLEACAQVSCTGNLATQSGAMTDFINVNQGNRILVVANNAGGFATNPVTVGGGATNVTNASNG